MSKHTPGPWKVLRDAVFHVETAYADQEYSGNICTVYEGTGMPKVMAEANARLLAAAPEMLEALKELAARFEVQGAKPNKDWPCLCNECVDSKDDTCRHTRARAAIAKAEAA